MNLFGEWLIAETTVTHNPDLEGLEFENFQKAALQLNRITRNLQDIAMAVRMLPIAMTFKKMVRLVRGGASRESNLVDLEISGEETEVGKTAIELIADPLVVRPRRAPSCMIGWHALNSAHGKRAFKDSRIGSDVASGGREAISARR
ncbi:MAG: hypothetical protein HRU17_21090, partial [Polyangiaceae bacterium]|nr:hypothetical protein [Polyangiaceae bacterium]